MIIKSDQGWSGAFPRAHPTKLSINQATFASGFRLDSGALTPWLSPLLKQTLTKPGPIKSIYRWGAIPGDENSGYWFHWSSDVNIAPAPINGDTEDRTYFSGDGAPKYTFAGIATSGGGTGYPNAYRTLGVPRPEGTINTVVTGVADPDADPEIDVVDKIYCVVFVTDKGEWGPPGAHSNTIPVILGQDVQLSSIPTPPSGYVITTKRIYRLATGSSGTDYYFVAEVDASNTDFLDTLEDADLGPPLISTNWLPPPDDLFGLGITSNGVAYGFSKNQICLGEPYLPHAWNPENQKVTGTPIIGGAHVRDMIVAFDHKKAYIVSGIDPSTMTVDEVDSQQTCISARSIVSTRYGIVYGSPDGLILIRGQNDEINLTQSYFDEKQWRALRPETILGCVYDNQYVGFFDDGVTPRGFIINPQHPELGIMFIDVHATAAYRDPLTDKLYLVINDNQIHEFNEGDKLTGIWRSGTIILPTDRKFSVTRVLVEGSVTVRIFINDNLIDERTVDSNTPYRIRMVRGRRVTYEIEGTGTVSAFELAESMRDLFG